MYRVGFDTHRLDPSTTPPRKRDANTPDCPTGWYHERSNVPLLNVRSGDDPSVRIELRTSVRSTQPRLGLNGSSAREIVYCAPATASGWATREIWSRDC